MTALPLETMEQRVEQLQAEIATVGIGSDFARVAAAREELRVLDGAIDAARQAQAEAAAAAHRTAVLAQLSELAAAGDQALAEVEAARAAIDSALATLLPAYEAALDRHQASRIAFTNALAEIAPGARSLNYRQSAEQMERLQTELDAALDQLSAAGVPLRGVRSNVISPIALPIDHHYRLPPSVFHEAINVALRRQR